MKTIQVLISFLIGAMIMTPVVTLLYIETVRCVITLPDDIVFFLFWIPVFLGSVLVTAILIMEFNEWFNSKLK